MKTLEAALFDLDGTLLDTAPDFFVVVNQLCESHQWPLKDYQSIRNTVSHGARALITLVSGLKPQEPGFEHLRQQLLDAYIEHLAVDTRFFEGLEYTLEWLEKKQIFWGIVTNKPRIYTEKLLSQLNLEQRCHTLVCPEDVANTKPDPEPILLACDQLNVSVKNCIYVGDHRRDIEAGQRAGMATIAANYGYIDDSDPAHTWGADHIVNHGEELIGIFERKL